MAVTLGTNIPAYVSRNILNGVTNSLTTTMEHLSTGTKINVAGDDAAGLVISQDMEATIRGSKQAMNNIQNAKSFLSVAEDGMVSISDHYQRINDLLTNMANDSNDLNARTAAVQEIIERLNEINRLAESIDFNGMKMLSGSVASIVVQMGATSDRATSTLDISPALTDAHVDAFGAALPDNLNPNAYVNASSEVVYKEKYGANEYWVTPANIIVYQDADGVYRKSDDDSEIAIANPSLLQQIKTGFTIKASGGDVMVVKNPRYTAGGSDPEYINATANTAFSAAADLARIDNANLTTLFEPNNLNCRAYMATVQEAISQLATNRGLIGAYENRMDSSYDALSTKIESLETAKGLYTDTDIAEESTNLIQQQIMQQINVAILAQANSMQQIALSLLS